MGIFYYKNAVFGVFLFAKIAFFRIFWELKWELNYPKKGCQILIFCAWRC